MNFLKTLFFIIFSLSQLVMANEKHFDFRVDFFEKNERQYLATTFKNESGWHSYWKNPGDAGLAVKILFQDIKPTPLNWPVPHTYISQEVLSYGYSGEYTFFFELDQNSINRLKSSPIEVKTQILICKDICIPGQQSHTLKLEDNKLTYLSAPASFITTQEKIELAFNEIPDKQELPLDFQLSFINSENELYLLYSSKASQLDIFDKTRNLMTPYLNQFFGLMKENLFYDSSQEIVYGVMKLSWEGEYLEPEVPLPSLGKISPPITLKFLLQNQGKSIISESLISEFKTLGAKELGVITSLPKYTGQGSSQGSSLLYILLFALIGGFILNLMPCVLPVISIKLMGLINSRSETPKRLLKHNLSYTAGVISTFLLLAAAVHGIKSTGSQIGWGFQLQSPAFVLLVTIVIFVMALNMLGLFEFKTPGASKLGSTELSESFKGDFFSGVISTILSTPCSAPFLGTALTYAFTTSSFNIYFIFLFIGLGLALPFILIGFFPKLISFLPKPGMWMNKLKYILGATLIITVIWLASIYAELTQSSGALLLLVLLLFSIFMAFFSAKKISKKVGIQAIFWTAPLIGLVLFFQQGYHLPIENKIQKTLNGNWKSWSPAKMQPGQLRFVNFTAQWCLTCKVNKRLVLDTERFYHFAKENNIELLEADWTHRDEVITKWLGSYDVVGVPAYFLQKINGEIVHLGETTSIGEIEDLL